jgi:hypothetical protein
VIEGVQRVVFRNRRQGHQASRRESAVWRNSTAAPTYRRRPIPPPPRSCRVVPGTFGLTTVTAAPLSDYAPHGGSAGGHSEVTAGCCQQ